MNIMQKYTDLDLLAFIWFVLCELGKKCEHLMTDVLLYAFISFIFMYTIH